MNQPKRILIVDDEELNRELLEDLIASFGHEPEMARDGVEAIYVGHGKKYSKMILHHNMRR